MFRRVFAVALMASALDRRRARDEPNFDCRCGSPEPSVKIANFTFQAPAVTVKPGTAVTWVNDDDIPHTIVANERRLQIESARHRRPLHLHFRYSR